MAKRILVTLVTGFLGSGKTTLLNRLLRHPEMADAAVIVNEFGEIGLDYDLIERSDESVVQLENGCLCCTVKSDLIDTFRDLHLMRVSGTVPRFERVVIETTGIADPGPVLQIILTDPLVSECYALDGIVTMVDAVNGQSTLGRFAESVKQVAVADRIVLTKTDLLSGVQAQAQMTELRDLLSRLNPGAEVLEGKSSSFSPDQLFGSGLTGAAAHHDNLRGWLQADQLIENGDTLGVPLPQGETAEQTYTAQIHQPLAEHSHDPNIRSFCLVREKPVALDTLRLFLEGLTRESGPDLLRVKGIINVAEQPERPAVIQGAQQIFHSLEWLPAWPGDDRRTRIVFITRGIDRAHVESTFELIERIAERTAAAAGRPL